MIANQTTTISSTKSVGEIQTMLVAARAEQVMINYAGLEPDALMFHIRIDGQPMSFRLPCNWRGTLEAIKREKRIARRLWTEEHARRVSWRVVRDWLRAQLSLIEAGQSSLQEVMLPWMLVSGGETVSHKILGGDGLLRLTHEAPP